MMSQQQSGAPPVIHMTAWLVSRDQTEKAALIEAWAARQRGERDRKVWPGWRQFWVDFAGDSPGSFVLMPFALAIYLYLLVRFIAALFGG